MGFCTVTHIIYKPIYEMVTKMYCSNVYYILEKWKISYEKIR